MAEENHVLNPYEMLGVSPNATMAEILKAYSQAMARRDHPPQELARALNTLRGKLSRAEVDLFSLPDLSSQLDEALQNAEQQDLSEVILRPPALLQTNDLLVMPEVLTGEDAIAPCPLEIMLPKATPDIGTLMPPVQINIWETMTDD
jgi:hypothetical protein